MFLSKPSHKNVIEEIRDRHSPITLFERVKDCRYPFFLDSAAYHDRLGRYSFLGCDPFLVFKSKKDTVTLEWQAGKTETFKANPFYALKDIFDKYKTAGAPGIPFTSGGVGYFSYDLKNFVEALPDTALDDLELPDCIMAFYDVIVIYDNAERRAYISRSGMCCKKANEFKRRILDRSFETEKGFYLAPPSLKSNFSKASYMKMIDRAKEYIKRGDIYQVNLSQRFEADLDMEPFRLYSRLRDVSPAPFAAYLDFKDVTILSSSPERFLLKRGNHIETRPIKGTRPRGADPLSDMSLEAELLKSYKDRAEHVMIVDLERNDLGRISEYGSVKADEFVMLEKYSTVFHLVSTISGKLKTDADPISCLLATFPGGSITGAPKIRSMEIIEELEGIKRSIYTGAIGYISFDGNMDTSIVIRTFLIKNKKIYFQVGGGIVADSDPEKEYDETLDKARGLMKSLGIEQKDGAVVRV